MFYMNHSIEFDGFCSQMLYVCLTKERRMFTGVRTVRYRFLPPGVVEQISIVREKLAVCCAPFETPPSGASRLSDLQTANVNNCAARVSSWGRPNGVVPSGLQW